MKNFYQLFILAFSGFLSFHGYDCYHSTNYRPDLAHLKSSIVVQTALPTVTVRGFLNFRTTVDGTVIVFTPASTGIPAESANNNDIRTTRTPSLPAPSIQSTRVPDMPITSRPSLSASIQPTKVPEVVTTATPAPTATGPRQQYPIGLVTVLGGTVVFNGATTVYETKVIGTYIDGKYAQILQSTAKLISPTVTSPTMTIQPTKTIPSIIVVSSIFGPKQIDSKTSVSESKEISLTNPKPTRFIDSNSIQSSIKNNNIRSVNAQLRSDNSYRNKFNSRLSLLTGQSRWSPSNFEAEDKKNETQATVSKARRLGTRRFQLPTRQSPRVLLNRFKVKLPRTGRYNKDEERFDGTQQTSTDRNDNNKLQSRVGHQRPQSEDEKKPQVEHLQLQPLHEQFQLETPSQPEAVESKPQPALHHQHHQHQQPAEQIDPEKVVKEIQTITSEVTQHVDGNNIQIQTVTMTTTIQRSLIHPSEFQADGVVAPTIPVEANDLEVTSVQETPPLVISRTYSVTERSMRTTVIPVFDGTATTSHTVTESFFIRKLITAYKTMPPGDVFLLDTASMGMPDSNATDLEPEEQKDPDAMAIEVTSIPDSDLVTATPASQLMPMMPSIEPSLLGLANGLPMQLPNLDMSNPLILAAALQNPQLAAVYLGLQQLRQQATQFNTITKPTTFVTTETIYNTKVVSFYDGRATRSRTISEPMATTEKTLTTYTTEVTPVINNNLAFQQAQLQNAFATQLMAPQLQITPQVSTITKTMTEVTEATATKTKVYTLVYNAFSTKFRTVTSTSVYPTTVTSTVTSTVPVPMTMANTAPAFGFFG